MLSLYSGLFRRPLTACKSFFLRYHTKHKDETHHLVSLKLLKVNVNKSTNWTPPSACQLYKSLPNSLLAVGAVTQGEVKLDLSSCTLTQENEQQGGCVFWPKREHFIKITPMPPNGTFPTFHALKVQFFFPEIYGHSAQIEKGCTGLAIEPPSNSKDLERLLKLDLPVFGPTHCQRKSGQTFWRVFFLERLSVRCKSSPLLLLLGCRCQ